MPLFCNKCGAVLGTGGECRACGTNADKSWARRTAQDWRVVSSHLVTDFDGRYKLFGLVVEIGDALVYKAFDTAHERNVTLLVIDPEIAADPSFSIGVMAAAEDAGDPVHSAVMPVMRFANARNGALYLELPELRHDCLRNYLLTEGALSPLQAMRVGLQLCSVITFAHGTGKPLGPFRPESLFVDVQGEKTHMRMLPPALVAQLDGRSEDTESDVPSYLAPEILIGDDIVTGSDFFNLGVVLYEMLTGELPFNGSTRSRVIARMISARPMAMGQFGFDAELWPGTEELLDELLAKAPRDRPASADAVTAAILAMIDRWTASGF